MWVDERVAGDGIAGPAAQRAFDGASIESIGRHGKVVVIGTSAGAIGLQFGMTGRVVVDGVAPIDRLEYASARDDPSWDRLVVATRPHAAPGVPAIRLNDPRRLGRVTLDPDLGALGVDLFDVDQRALTAAFAGRTKAVKTALLDQHVVAGLGNLCADEVLWWAGIAPQRSVDDLTADEVRRLAGVIRRRMPIMLRRGGSTTGSLAPDVREPGGACPRDGAPLRRDTVAARTAVWCPAHQH